MFYYDKLLTVCSFLRILHLGEERILILLNRERCLEIVGRNLCLVYLEQREIKIAGTICSINFQEAHGAA